eukprot:7310587-Prymnesium_polylepis.1
MKSTGAVRGMRTVHPNVVRPCDCAATSTRAHRCGQAIFDSVQNQRVVHRPVARGWPRAGTGSRATGGSAGGCKVESTPLHR